MNLQPEELAAVRAGLLLIQSTRALPKDVDLAHEAAQEDYPEAWSRELERAGVEDESEVQA